MFPFFCVFSLSPPCLSFSPRYFILTLFFSSPHPPVYFSCPCTRRRGSSEQSMRAVHQPEAQLAEQHTTQSVWAAAAQRNCWRPTEVDTLSVYSSTSWLNSFHESKAHLATEFLNIKTGPTESTAHQGFIFKIEQTGPSALARISSPLPTPLSLNTLGAMLMKLSDKAAAMFLFYL